MICENAKVFEITKNFSSDDKQKLIKLANDLEKRQNSIDDPDVVNLTGLGATTAIGSVSVIDDAGTWDSTGETLDSTAQTYDEG